MNQITDSSNNCGGCYGAVDPLVHALQHYLSAALQVVSSLTAMNPTLLTPFQTEGGFMSSATIDAMRVVNEIERLRSRGGGATTGPTSVIALSRGGGTPPSTTEATSQKVIHNPGNAAYLAEAAKLREEHEQRARSSA
eukprot:PhF_6_TR33289/c0_g1_i1/m.48762